MTSNIITGGPIIFFSCTDNALVITCNVLKDIVAIC